MIAQKVTEVWRKIVKMMFFTINTIPVEYSEETDREGPRLTLKIKE